MSVVSQQDIFADTPPATYRSCHTLAPNQSRITSATVGMLSTFRLVLVPSPHSVLDVQNWGKMGARSYFSLPPCWDHVPCVGGS